MPQCIECGHYMTEIINPDTRTVNRCPSCDKICDTYYEFDEVQKWIDVGLLRRRAWAHMLFNKRDIFLTSLYVALLCCCIEAFVVRSDAVLLAHTPSTSTEAVISPSLQLVRIIKGPYFRQMDYTGTLPRLLFYAIQEYVLIAVAAAWMGNVLRSRSSNPLRRWVFAVSLAVCSQLSYGIFLIWVTPIYLLPIVDGIFVLWLTRGFRTLLIDQPWIITFWCVAVCVLARVFLRYASGWAPQLLL